MKKDADLQLQAASSSIECQERITDVAIFNAAFFPVNPG